MSQSPDLATRRHAGGSAWKMVASARVFGRFTPDSEMKKHAGSFWDEWEHKIGPIVSGRRDTKPPAGVFLRWYRENKLTGVSAGEFLERLKRGTNTSKP